MLARLRSLLRLLFVWKIRPKDSGGEPDCIIMLAFGQEERPIPLGAGLCTHEVVPGPANEALARTTIQFLRAFLLERIPILAQWELLNTLYGEGHHRKFPIVELGARGTYRNTREILLEAKEVMARNGWSTATIVAHPYHLARCTWVAEKLCIEVVHDRSLIQDLETFANVWNRDVGVPENQMQTTSPARWWWYELRARAYFWLKGWI